MLIFSSPQSLPLISRLSTEVNPKQHIFFTAARNAGESATINGLKADLHSLLSLLQSFAQHTTMALPHHLKFLMPMFLLYVISFSSSVIGDAGAQSVDISTDDYNPSNLIPDISVNTTAVSHLLSGVSSLFTRQLSKVTDFLSLANEHDNEADTLELSTLKSNQIQTKQQGRHTSNPWTVDEVLPLNDGKILSDADDTFIPYVAREVEPSVIAEQPEPPIISMSPSPSFSNTPTPTLSSTPTPSPSPCACSRLFIGRPGRTQIWTMMGRGRFLTRLAVIVRILPDGNVLTLFYVNAPRRIMHLYSRLDFARTFRARAELKGAQYTFQQNKLRIRVLHPYSLSSFCAPRRYPVTITVSVRIGGPSNQFGNRFAPARKFVQYGFTIRTGVICQA